MTGDNPDPSRPFVPFSRPQLSGLGLHLWLPLYVPESRCRSRVTRPSRPERHICGHGVLEAGGLHGLVSSPGVQALGVARGWLSGKGQGW